MIYRISDEIVSEFPQFLRAIVIANGIDNTSTTIHDLEILLSTKCEEIRDSMDITLDHPRIKSWYETYKSFGTDLSKNQPSIANLVQRIKKGNVIPFISPIVAIMNLISLTYLIPCGGIDARKVSGDLVLGKASGKESFLPFGKKDKSFVPPGEVIYYDEDRMDVICRCWNSKGSQLTMILPETKSVIIDLDAMVNVIPREVVLGAASQLAKLINTYCGGDVKIDFLNSERPEILVNSV